MGITQVDLEKQNDGEVCVAYTTRTRAFLIENVTDFFSLMCIDKLYKLRKIITPSFVNITTFSHNAVACFRVRSRAGFYTQAVVWKGMKEASLNP